MIKLVGQGCSVSYMKNTEVADGEHYVVWFEKETCNDHTYSVTTWKSKNQFNDYKNNFKVHNEKVAVLETTRKLNIKQIKEYFQQFMEKVGIKNEA